MLARLQEELSRWTYSEHGLLAVIRPVSGQVCQSLIVPSYWMPGSAHSQAALAILCIRPLAPTVLITSPVRRASRAKLRSSSYGGVNSAGNPALLLLARLGLDELLDVRVVDVEDHHLGRAPGGTAGLDRARRGVGAA